MHIEKDEVEFLDLLQDMIELVRKHEKVIVSDRMKRCLQVAKEKGSNIGKKPDNNPITEQIAELYKDGLTIREISDKLKVTISCVTYRLKKAGIVKNGKN